MYAPFSIQNTEIQFIWEEYELYEFRNSEFSYLFG